MTNTMNQQLVNQNNQAQFKQENLQCTPAQCKKEITYCQDSKGEKVDVDYEDCECDIDPDDKEDARECLRRTWMKLGSTHCSSKKLGKCHNKKTHEVEIVATEKSCEARNRRDGGDHWEYIATNESLGQCHNLLTEEIEEHHTTKSCSMKNDKKKADKKKADKKKADKSDAEESDKKEDEGEDAEESDKNEWVFKNQYKLHVGCHAVEQHKNGSKEGLIFVNKQRCLEHSHDKLQGYTTACSCHLHECDQWCEDTEDWETGKKEQKKAKKHGHKNVDDKDHHEDKEEHRDDAEHDNKEEKKPSLIA
jgi:hypothetical protein